MTTQHQDLLALLIMTQRAILFQKSKYPFMFSVADLFLNNLVLLISLMKLTDSPTISLLTLFIVELIRIKMVELATASSSKLFLTQPQISLFLLSQDPQDAPPLLQDVSLHQDAQKHPQDVLLTLQETEALNSRSHTPHQLNPRSRTLSTAAICPKLTEEALVQEEEEVLAQEEAPALEEFKSKKESHTEPQLRSLIELRNQSSLQERDHH